MRAGPLDRRVTIQRMTLVDDGYGETEEWRDLICRAIGVELHTVANASMVEPG